mmetsp:Transcript_42821/g.103177  ORF Transcript_42821/g.103177 Transcript_42821/m.103177 type:complete len:214 (+) Transcript_42821:3313-3954(+)
MPHSGPVKLPPSTGLGILLQRSSATHRRRHRCRSYGRYVAGTVASCPQPPDAYRRARRQVRRPCGASRCDKSSLRSQTPWPPRNILPPTAASWAGRDRATRHSPAYSQSRSAGLPCAKSPKSLSHPGLSWPVCVHPSLQQSRSEHPARGRHPVDCSRHEAPGLRCRYGSDPKSASLLLRHRLSAQSGHPHPVLHLKNWRPHPTPSNSPPLPGH